MTHVVKDYKLWYNQPASDYLEALPIGNGNLGAMIFGDPAKETVWLNDATFWSGKTEETNLKQNAKASLPEIRSLLFEGKHIKATLLGRKNLVGNKRNYGTNLPVAKISLEFPNSLSSAIEYRRELTLNDSVAKVYYNTSDNEFSREYFLSNPDSVCAVRLSAKNEESLTFGLKCLPFLDLKKKKCSSN